MFGTPYEYMTHEEPLKNPLTIVGGFSLFILIILACLGAHQNATDETYEPGYSIVECTTSPG